MSKNCPRCGQALSIHNVRGLCPKCLGLLAFSPEEDSEPAAARTMAVQPISDGREQKEDALTLTLRYFGDYELLEEIARGGMGVVFKARQTSLDRIVAVKMIRSGQLASEQEVQRFHTEAQAAANLQHPNIVAIHEVGQQAGLHYFSMDFVEGMDLAAFIKTARPSARDSAKLVQTLAEAIHFAHQRGTLHRDLKPHNVLVDAAGQPRISDFGLAKLTQRGSELTRTGEVMGSPSYMAPEQACGRQDLIGPASDVYSLGAVFYELLTGQPPFKCDTPVATLRKVIEENPVAPARLNVQTPRDLETICLKCLEKKPERRYPSARELAEELGRFLREEPILARLPAGVERPGTGSSAIPGC